MEDEGTQVLAENTLRNALQGSHRKLVVQKNVKFTSSPSYALVVTVSADTLSALQLRQIHCCCA